MLFIKGFCDNSFSIVPFVVLLRLSSSAAWILLYCVSECCLAQHVLIKGLVMLRVVCEDEKKKTGFVRHTDISLSVLSL